MTSKNSLPCGHAVDETAAKYVRTDIKNFYTCRKTEDHDGCSPSRQYIAEPFHWREIVARERTPIPEASTEETSLREQLKQMVRNRMRSGGKKQ